MAPEPVSVEAQLAVINTKLDLLIATKDDQETRLRKLEQFRWLLMGVALAAGPVTNAIAARLQ